MSLIKNSFAVLGVIAVGVVGADFLMPEEQQAKLKASMTHLIKSDHTDDATRKITVYESQGKRGEAIFSDQQHGQARPRVVDTAKGTTFHTELPKQEDQDGLHFKPTPLQQKAAAFKQAQMDQIINQ